MSNRFVTVYEEPNKYIPGTHVRLENWYSETYTRPQTLESITVANWNESEVNDLIDHARKWLRGQDNAEDMISEQFDPILNRIRANENTRLGFVSDPNDTLSRMNPNRF